VSDVSSDVRTLRELPVGAGAAVVRLNGRGATKQRLLDMGLTPGAHLVLTRVAPLGDPVQVTVRGARVSLRKADADTVLVRPDAPGSV
jgi:ferrous iron transport protein A